MDKKYIAPDISSGKSKYVSKIITKKAAAPIPINIIAAILKEKFIINE
tara:strand:- start:915 stop:1058 length:144 start_codon:yes stop_codon:yes gene_type:complete